MSDAYKTSTALSVARDASPEARHWIINLASERDHCKDEAASLRHQLEAERERVAELKSIACESQTWNWISAHEEMDESDLDQYPIDDMQRLHESVADSAVDSWLLRKQAEAVDSVAEQLSGWGDTVHHRKLVESVKNEAQRLRRRADEMEREGE